MQEHKGFKVEMLLGEIKFAQSAKHCSSQQALVCSRTNKSVKKSADYALCAHYLFSVKCVQKASNGQNAA